MNIELLVTACSLLQGAQCREVSLVYSDEISLLTCMMSAQPQIARWAEEHPNWSVQKWTCRPAGQIANI